MIQLLIFSILFVYINGDLNLCIGQNATSKPVIDYCRTRNGVLEFRCCYTLNSKNILSIDLTEMNFDKIPDLNEYINLTVIIHFVWLSQDCYYRYKCLRYVQFTGAKFFGLVIFITIVLNVFFYFTQRRYVKKV